MESNASSTTQGAQSAEPTVSAPTSNTPKEGTMDGTTGSTASPAGSTASTSGAPTDSAQKTKKPRTANQIAGAEAAAANRYKPSAPIKEAEAEVTAAAGSSSARIIEDVGKVKADVAALWQLARPVADASEAIVQARLLYTPDRLALRDTLNRVGGVLKATPAGRDFYAGAEGATPFARAASLLAQTLPQGDAVVPDSLLADLRARFAKAGVTKAALDAAIGKRAEAISAYTSAKTQLTLDVRALRSDLASERLAEKASVHAAKKAEGPAILPTPATGPAATEGDRSNQNGHSHGWRAES